MKRDKHASENRNHGVRWAVSELNYLEAHYQTAPLVDMATHLGRTASAIMAMAGKLGLSRTENVWSDEELRCLHQYYPVEGQRIMRRLPRKSDEAIRFKARDLGIVSPGHTYARQWVEQEWQLLHQNRHQSPLELMQLFPDRSLSSIKNALIRLKRDNRQGTRPAGSTSSKKVTITWTKSEKAILLRWYETSKTMEEILAMLPGRPRASVFAAANKLGLFRPLSDWTEKEIQILKDHYPKEGPAVVKRLPGRQRRTTSQKAAQLGLRMNSSTPRHTWSPEDWERLEKHLHLSFPELQRLFPGRSLSSLKNACNRVRARRKAEYEG
ncbi:hypothetical protein MUU49_01690 [Scandinavium goeteborgense]|uniref:hypothetical protein n=1 Tax=Scandinavium goeteborgense TaxID=1851514 RepID=UPI00216665DD|nr:hypothetical protein [Scandinavium goeteborgense]MCS2151295.1 hypothetical protein [Scandinavium goeteborgense]